MNEKAASVPEYELCPDCGIPLVWCNRVSSSAEHCWRWDYEQFDETTTRLERRVAELEGDRERLTKALAAERASRVT